LATLSLPAKSTSQSLLRVHSPVIKFSPFTITHSMLSKTQVTISVSSPYY
jgi:hypothetical protein